jgi:disulfide bond formation protein DsbB
MGTLASSMNMLWASLVILVQIFSVVLIIALFSKSVRRIPVVAFFKERSILIAFIVSLLATVGSLIYSDVIGYEPCKLCWFQRIFMYPQVLIMLIALIRKDAGARLYGFWFSIIGAAIALFHYVGQLGWNPFNLECLAIGYSSSCAKNFVLELGYITIPMMAFAAFVLIALTFALSFRKEDQIAAE